MITNEELAYLAGIIDGEGYIGISIGYNRYKGKLLNGVRYTLKVVVTNTNIDLVNWVIHKFGFSLTVRKNYKSNFSKKQVYNCYIQSNDALELIKLVHPYLIIKRSKADLIINKWPELGVRDVLSRTEVYNGIKEINKIIKTNRILYTESIITKE